MNIFLKSKYHNKLNVLDSMNPLKFVNIKEDSNLVKEFSFYYRPDNSYDNNLIQARLLLIDNHILANKAIIEGCYDDLISRIDLYILNYKCDKFFSLIEAIKVFKNNSLNLLNNQTKRDFKSYMSLYLKKNDSLKLFMRSYIISYFFNVRTFVRTEEEDNGRLLYFIPFNNGIRYTEFTHKFLLRFEAYDDEAYWGLDVHFYNLQIIFSDFFYGVVEKFINLY